MGELRKHGGQDWQGLASAGEPWRGRTRGEGGANQGPTWRLPSPRASGKAAAHRRNSMSQTLGVHTTLTPKYQISMAGMTPCGANPSMKCSSGALEITTFNYYSICILVWEHLT